MVQSDAKLPRNEMSADDLDALRPYVVDLENGRFSGLPGAPNHAVLKTVPADIDAIFTKHLPAFGKSRGGGPVPVVFWAHGGLVSEASALATAKRQIPWWLANGVYPIHFVWHSSFWDTVGDLIADHVHELWPASLKDKAKDASGKGVVCVPARGLNSPVTDFTNKLIEDLLRRVGGPAVWAAMKENARNASEPSGGAAYVASAMATFQTQQPGLVEVHAAGFSAGANFQEHFVPALVHSGSMVNTCALLVPAMSTQAFQQRLMPLQNQGVDQFALFGMKSALARADNCFGIYRGSILHLISAALDATPNTPILGLQECVDADPALNTFFAVAPEIGPASAAWSVTLDGPLDARTAATTHSAFDEDVPTMDSVMRLVTGRDDIVSFGATSNASLLSVAARARS